MLLQLSLGKLLSFHLMVQYEMLSIISKSEMREAMCAEASWSKGSREIAPIKQRVDQLVFDMGQGLLTDHEVLYKCLSPRHCVGVSVSTQRGVGSSVTHANGVRCYQ